MLAYSARKNSANAMPEYSTWKPATISDSPSATSNGARLVSATPETKYTTSSGNSQNQFQLKGPPCCARMMSPTLRLPDAIRTPTMAKPMAISYATICAAERIAPRKAYLELAAQPARMIPYTPIEVSARMYKSPASMFENARSGANGMTAQTASEGINARNGAKRNKNPLASAGTTISLKISLNTSANGWPSPGTQNKLTRFGPLRNWIQPMTLRSAKV